MNPASAYDKSMSKKLQQSGNIAIIALVIILVVVLGLVAAFLSVGKSQSLQKNIGNRSQSNRSPRASPSVLPQPSSMAKWQLPKSTVKAYPFYDRKIDKFVMYQLGNGKKLISDKYGDYGGASGWGTSSFVVSPNLLYTAAIEKQTNNLYVVSNETLERALISKGGTAVYVSGWTPNSKKLIYYISQEEMGMGGPAVVIYDRTIEPGFYLFDLESGSSTKLFPIKYFEHMIDNDRALIRPSSDSNYLAIFNFHNFTTDFAAIKDEFRFGSGQFNFSPDSRYWAFLYNKGNTTTDGMQLIFGKFPNIHGTVVEDSRWVDAQSPIISPDNQSIAYIKSENVVVYTVTDKVVKIHMPGRPMMWIDSQTLVVQSYETTPTMSLAHYSLLNINTDQVTKMD